MNEKPAVTERRDYFRIDDRVALRIRPVADPGVPVQAPAELQSTYALLEELHSIDVEHSVILRSINDKSRDLGQYLKAQQHKLELLARHLVLAQTRDLFALVDVNISGNGIGFESRQHYIVGDRFDLDVVLFPEAWCTTVRAQVISVSAQTDHELIGAEFVDLNDEQRDAIVRHCLLIDGHKRRLERGQ